MGLETGSFIAELVDTNPIGATDTVSEGDNHLRLIKQCVQGSFPAFIGTTVAPKFVTLTEDEINILIDAAIKNIAQTISGEWVYTALQIYQALVSFENFVEFEDNAGNVTLETVTAALGSLLVADQTNTNALKVGFRDPIEEAAIAGSTLKQASEGQVTRYTGIAGVLSVPVLLAQTNITLLHSGSGDITLTQDGTTINWLDGAGAANTGNRTIVPNSVVHLRWDTGSTIDIWGNGIS